MKKIENLLLLTAIIILCWPHPDRYSYDLHVHDTYYVIGGFPKLITAGMLLMLFILYRIIRMRHRSVNRIMAVTHIVITILFIANVLYSFIMFRAINKSTVLNYSNWQEIQAREFWSNLINFIFIAAFLIIQFIFLLYFIIRIIQRPRAIGNTR